MENASKALIMAASVLLGVMIISFAVYLFSIFASQSSDIAGEMTENRAIEYNTRFTKYYGRQQRDNPYGAEPDGTMKEYDGPILCTVQDVISLAKLARNINNDYGFYDDDDDYVGTDTELYININISGILNGNNIENWSGNEFTNFIKENTFIDDTAVPRQIKYFYIPDDGIRYVNSTDAIQLVNSVTFREIDVTSYLS